MKHTMKKLIILSCMVFAQSIATYVNSAEINDDYTNGVVTEYPESVLRFHKKMAENGNLSAQKLLGNLYLSGNEIQVDLNESIKWFTMAAKTGDFDSINKLMLIDVMRNGFSDDIHSGWYKKLQNTRPLTSSTSQILLNVKKLKGDGA